MTNCNHNPANRVTLRTGETVCAECRFEQPPPSVLLPDPFASATLGAPCFKHDPAVQAEATLAAFASRPPGAFLHLRTWKWSEALVAARAMDFKGLVFDVFRPKEPQAYPFVQDYLTVDDPDPLELRRLAVQIQGRLTGDFDTQDFYRGWVDNCRANSEVRILGARNVQTGRINAFVAFDRSKIQLLCVDQAHRLQRLGSMLVSRIPGAIGAITQREAMPFYEALGFRLTDIGFDFHLRS